jgi:type I restriction enzyme M protein
MVSRINRELTDNDIARIAKTYHAWRGEREAGQYVDVPGFCASAGIEEVAKHGYVLTPGRYVGAEEVDEGSEPLDEKIARLTKELYDAFEESDRQQMRVKLALGRIDV